MTPPDTLLITNDDIQAAIVDYTKTLTSVVNLLTTSNEIRELNWQGDDFVYPNVRVSVDLTPSINGCAPYRAQIFFDCFSEDKSSHEAQTIAGAIQKAYHRVVFSQNNLKFSSVIVRNIRRAQRSIYAWQSTVEVEVLVN